MSVFTEQSVFIPTVTEGFHIQVLRVDKVFKDGELISAKNHRHVLAPGDDLTNEDPIVQAVANAVWTEEVIANYRASIEQTEVAPTETPE